MRKLISTLVLTAFVLMVQMPFIHALDMGMDHNMSAESIRISAQDGDETFCDKINASNNTKETSVKLLFSQNLESPEKGGNSDDTPMGTGNRFMKRAVRKSTTSEESKVGMRISHFAEIPKSCLTEIPESKWVQSVEKIGIVAFILISFVFSSVLAFFNAFQLSFRSLFQRQIFYRETLYLGLYGIIRNVN